MAGSNKVAFARLLSKFRRLPTHFMSLLREAVCVATAAARGCCLLALLRSPPGSAYSYVSTEPVLVHEKQFSGCVGFVLVCLCGTCGHVLFASVFVVMKEHVFAENGLRGAMQWGNKDCGHLADGKTVKNCAI